MLTCSQTLLTLLQLFEESKIPGNFRRHCESRICLERLSNQLQLQTAKYWGKQKRPWMHSSGRGAVTHCIPLTAERSSAELPRDDNYHVCTISALAFPGDATPDAFVDRPTFRTKSRFLAILCLGIAYKLEGFVTLALLQGVRISVVKLPLFQYTKSSPMGELRTEYIWFQYPSSSRPCFDTAIDLKCPLNSCRRSSCISFKSQNERTLTCEMSAAAPSSIVYYIC